MKYKLSKQMQEDINHCNQYLLELYLSKSSHYNLSLYSVHVINSCSIRWIKMEVDVPTTIDQVNI